MGDVQGKVIPILLVEDDDEDVFITKRAFTKGRIVNDIHVVGNGAEALDFLRHKGRYTDEERYPRPGLILLDLNLPGINGREVLMELKKDAELRRIPVVVLTTSSEEADVFRCYDLGANTYITKPVDFMKFVEAVTVIGEYWMCFAKIPNGHKVAVT